MKTLWDRRGVHTGVLAAIGAASGYAACGKGAPALLKRSRDLTGEMVNVADYCAGDGVRPDHQNLQELINLNPRVLVYPANRTFLLKKGIQLRSRQEHRFESGAMILAATEDYAFSGLGLQSQSIGRVPDPIQRFSTGFELVAHADLAPGDMILIADVTDAKNIRIDPNVILQIDGSKLTTKYRMAIGFPNPHNIRVYKIYEPLTDVAFRGGVLRNVGKGGGINLSYARNASISGLRVDGVGYIGIGFVGSLFGTFEDVAFNGTGASALGFRASKNITINRMRAENTLSDESLTFYQNVSNVSVQDVEINQYTYQERNNSQRAGNNILVDGFCSYIAMSNVRCNGSATYNVMINDHSEFCSLDKFSLSRSNLGGIRISSHSNNNRIGAGSISDVTDLVDQESSTGRKKVSGITVGSDCMDNEISNAIEFRSIRSGLNVGVL